ncbi:glucose-1-phosphate thymidylyltransferase [bacterium]|nr:glucose-1-phosphate thymidylyltransferase [bacterium]
MKALITSGGHGTRLRPITHTQNKHLIPIGNKPILHFALENVANAKIREVGILTRADSDEVEKAIGDGSRWGLKITYIPQEAPLGLAHVVKISRPFIGNDSFLFYLGDNMVVGGVDRFVRAFEASKASCHLTLARVKDPERFGVPELDGNRIVSIEEKPRKPKSRYAVTGIYLYDSRIFEACDAIKPSARGELEISDAHQWLLDHGARVEWSEITGWWKDTGKPEDLLAANRLVLENQEPRISGEVDAQSEIEGRVVIEEGARVVASRIRGPAIVGKNAVVTESYIGPYTSIGAEARVTRSEVEHSIVLERCRIDDVGVRIESSILGTGVEVVRSREKPRTHRFFVGDQSRIEVV